MRILITARTALGAVAIGLLAAGCSAAGTPERAGSITTYVGKVTGTDALLAVVESADRVVAYVCDSKDMAWWFAGSPRADGAFDLTSRTGQRLAGKPSGDVLSATLTLPGGSTRTVNAREAVGDAGLYFADQTVNGIHYQGGWIWASATEQRGNLQSSQQQKPGPTTVHPGHPPFVTEEGFIDPLKFLVEQAGVSEAEQRKAADLVAEGSVATLNH